jgi:sodium/hydrogen antiporter
MTWEQIGATRAHLTYLLLPAFLIVYALFSRFIRNKLHLSEPPLALVFGIILGPRVTGVLHPKQWGPEDPTVQEFTRIIVGIQVFAVGLELPKFYFMRHWKSVGMLLGPVMTFSWVVTALCCYLVLGTSVETAMIVAACLTPTDSVLAASVLSNSTFSTRVPKQLEHLLSAESGCNDGVSFPFLYIGICILKESSTGAIKEWFLITVLWQCAFGIFIGILIGVGARKTLRFCDDNNYIGRASFLVYYLLLAILSVGVGSTLGSDDFLVAFGAGVGFARDGWFARKTEETHLPNIIDLLLNSSMFVYFGAIVPWPDFAPCRTTPGMTA